MTFEPSRAAWRALPAARRRLIARGAWHNETAIEAGDARAAVQYGRFALRWATVSGAGLAVVAAVTAWSARFDEVVTIVLGGVAGMLAVLGLIAVWARLLIRNNVDAAARCDPPLTSTSLRLGPRWPWTAFAIKLAVVGELAGMAIALHHYSLAVAGAAVLLAVAADGPTAARPVSATVDDGGITFPAYRARVPWSSIHDAWAVGATSLTVLITGPYQPTGRLPTSWRRQIDKRLRGEVRIAARRPEALLAVTERNRPGRTRPNTDPAQPAPNSR